MNRTKLQGFTMIELIMVIVVLGILAATALPKFVNMGGEARAATLQAMLGSLNSSIAMIHGVALIAGTTDGELAVSGVGTITLANGYPSKIADNLTKMLEFDSTLFTIADGSITRTDATTPANCVISMANSTAVNTPPVVNITTTGC